MENPFSGLNRAPGDTGPRLALQRLGHQVPRLVIKHNKVPKMDIEDGLRVCSIDSVFADPEATFIVFGTPNVSLLMPSADNTDWDRLAAYMFWRQDTAIIPSKGRVQAGVFCELRNISHEARKALRQASESLVGTREASCAHTIALALHNAGFHSGTGRLHRIYRPSHLAAVLWGGELFYNGEPVELRWITTEKSAHDHFKATWWREYKSLPRLVQKYISKGRHTPAPVLPRNDHVLDAADGWSADEQQVRISINVPSPFGVNLAYLGRVGPQPEFSVELPQRIGHPLLQRPLKPFDRKLDKITFLKSKVLFSPLTCWLMGNVLERDIATTDHIPVSVVAKMLACAPNENPDPLYKYNFVLTPTRLKIKRLLANDGRENKFLAWMLAKHVLLSRWRKDVIAAGELWVCEINGELGIFINGESGSYQPTYAQITAVTMVLSEMLGVDVFVGERPTA